MKRATRKADRTGYFNIAEVAQMLDVSPSTLRMWEKVGLVTPQRSDGKYRLYTPEDIKRLKRIKYLKSTKHLNVGGILHVLAQERPPRSAAAPTSKSKTTAETLGQKLRRLRREQKMTLEDVAKRAELSVGFLSSLERSQANASIATLQKLARLYKTNFMSFFDETEGASKLVRPAERKVLETQPGTRIEMLAVGETVMETQLWSIAPGTSSGGAYDHEGEEFIFVLQGRFEVWLGEVEHYALQPGDSLYFSSAQPHRWLNPGKTETKLLWVNTPPTF